MTVPTPIAALPGFDLLLLSRRRGTVWRYPVIGWAVTLTDNGELDCVRPITPNRVESSSDLASAIRWPGGRVYDLALLRLFDSEAEWIFEVRACASGHVIGGCA